MGHAAAVMAFYGLLACIVVYWPLFHVRTHVPAEPLNDYFHFNWNYWWIRHALTTPGLHVYETNFVLFPYTTNLAFHTLTPFWFPVWALVEPLAGTLIAMQVIIVLIQTLNGTLIFALLRHERVSGGLALVGGALFMLTFSLWLSITFTHLTYLCFFWLPAALLAWDRVACSADRWRRGLAWAVIMGLVFYGTLMTDYSYLLYDAFILVPFGLLTLVRARTWSARARLAALGLLAVALMLVLGWIAGPLHPLLDFDRGTLAPASAEGTHFIPFPEGYIWRFAPGDRRVTLGSVIVPLLLITLLANLTALRGRGLDRRRWFWLALAIVPLLLSAGDHITIGGTDIRMPYHWFHPLLGNMFRRPDRFGTVFLIPALIFIGQTWGPLLIGRVRLRRIVPLAALLIVFVDARLFVAMPIKPVVPTYEFYSAMGHETGEPYDEYVVLEVPVAAGTGETWVGQFEQLQTQFYGMTHGKRMVNGLLARAPVENYWYLRTDDPLLSWLGQRRPLDPDLATPELRQIIFDWPVGYVVVHTDLIGANTSTVAEVLGYLNAQPDLLCPVWVEKDAIVYRTAWHPDGCPDRTPPQIAPGVYQIDIGSADDRRYIGWGWHWPEQIFDLSVRWTGDRAQTVFGLEQRDPGPHPQADLYVDLPPGGYMLTITAQAFERVRQLDVSVNGVALGTAQIAPDGLAPVTFDIPAEAIGDGRHITVTLTYDGADAPTGSTESDPRRLALMVDTVQFAAQ